MPTEYDRRLAQLALRKGLANREQLLACARKLTRLEAGGRRFDMADALLASRFATPRQIGELDAELQRAGHATPPVHVLLARQREAGAARMSRVELGELPDEAFGGAVVCASCGASIVEETLQAGDDASQRLCARCRAEKPKPGQVYQGYRIGAEIGAGRVGTVYAARDLKGLRDVAFKIIPESRLRPPATPEALLNALSAAIKLNSPRLVRTLAFGRWGRGVYLVSELAQEPTLRASLEQTASLPAAERVRRLAHPLETAIEAVAAAHALGVVHGEASPRRFFVSGAGEARLAGAGLPPSPFFSVAPHAQDTWYLAPAGLSGPAADAFALDRLCVEVLTSRQPSRIDDLPAGDVLSLPRKARAVLAGLLDANRSRTCAVPACRLAASKIISSF